MKLLAWICPRAFIPWWVPRQVFIPPEVPPRPSVIERVASPASLLRKPRQPRDLLDFARPRRTRRLVSLTDSPAYYHSKLPASRSRRPRDLFSGQIHLGASIPRSVPRRASIRPQVPVVCKVRSSGRSGHSNRTCTKRACAFASLQKDRFRMMVAAWSCFPCLQRIDSG